MDFQIGTLRPEGSSIIVDITIGEERERVGSFVILPEGSGLEPGIVSFDAPSPLTDDRMIELFSRVRDFAAKHADKIATMRSTTR